MGCQQTRRHRSSDFVQTTESRAREDTEAKSLQGKWSVKNCSLKGPIPQNMLENIGPRQNLYLVAHGISTALSQE